jgi:hypothetical protein
LARSLDVFAELQPAGGSNNTTVAGALRAPSGALAAAIFPTSLDELDLSSGADKIDDLLRRAGLPEPRENPKAVGMSFRADGRHDINGECHVESS